jgi:hypothetical protein
LAEALSKMNLVRLPSEMATRPCIVIPGILGSSLEDFYPLAPETAWSAASVVESKLVAPDFDGSALDEVATVVSRFLSGRRGPGLLPKGLPSNRFHP